MRLCVSAVLLLFLALTRAAPDPTSDPGSDPTSDPGSEECSKFDILKDKTQILGRTHMMAAYTDNDVAKNMLGLISSLWSDINETQTGFSVAQFYKMNGTCVESRFNMTVSGDTVKVLMFGMLTESKFLNFSSTSMIMDLRTAAMNFTTMIEKLHLDPNIDQSPSNATQEVKLHNIYLISKEAELNEMDLQRFRAHAKCEGYTGEPVFLRNSTQEYCSEEESVLIR